MNRRTFLGGTAAMAGTVAAAAVEEKLTDGGLAPVSWPDRPNRDRPVLPPGAHSPERFASRCVGCGLCVSVCPSQCLRFSTKPGRFGRVELDFRHGWCKSACTVCGETCPSGAIEKVRFDAKCRIHVGVAEWRREPCLRTQGVECHACEKHCPSRAIKIVAGLPVVDPVACTGCGACEHYCPARPETAIRVVGYAKHREISPMGEEDLLAEMRTVLDTGKALVAAAGGVIFAAPTGRGVDPALALLDADRERLRGAVVMDRVVGRAAAGIWAFAGVRLVAAPVMSAAAKALLEENGVAVRVGKIVPSIINREGTGPCPMDSKTAALKTPAEIVRALRGK